MTQTIQTDYLVVGAGAAGMSVVDELITHSDAEIVLVDRRHGPGGHWLDAYPFVRLHQPSAYYGVNSRSLGFDRIDDSGPNAGFYERASAAEICDYYRRVLDERFLASGRVTFLGMHEYDGVDSSDAGGHLLSPQLGGPPVRVHVRRRVIDATYVESIVPSRRPPEYRIDPGVSVLTPNQLVHHGGTGGDVVVIGAGKTAMDTCVWLLENAVDPGRIRWVRPRDGWFVDRTYTQPHDLVGSMMTYQAATIEVAAEVSTGLDFALAMEEREMMFRLDPAVEPVVYRGATLSRLELDQLRSIEQVVRMGRVRAVAPGRVYLDDGDIATGAEAVFVDCTAPGLANSATQPIFDHDLIRIQLTTLGVSPWSAAMIGFVETLDLTDDQRNGLCPPIPRPGLISTHLDVLAIGLGVEPTRRANLDLTAWNAASRLCPGSSVAGRENDPAVQAAFEVMLNSFGPALANLASIASQR
ncbi:MAG: NAD(P)-binding protein [Actinomycetota bacterium]